MPQPIINKTALFFFGLPSVFVSVTAACTSVHLCHQQPRDHAVWLRIHLVVPSTSKLRSMELRLCIVLHFAVQCVLSVSLPPFIFLCWFSVVVFPCPVVVVVLHQCAFWLSVCVRSDQVASPSSLTSTKCTW